MALVIESGSGADAGANSYATDEQFVAYAAGRGITIPATAAEREVLLLKAMDYIETLEPRFSGSRKTRAQPLAWPRVGAFALHFTVGESEVPPELVLAQSILAVEAMTTELLPTILPPERGAVTMERVEGAVTVQYAQPSPDAPNRAQFARAEAVLRPVMGSRRLVTVR